MNSAEKVAITEKRKDFVYSEWTITPTCENCRFMEKLESRRLWCRPGKFPVKKSASCRRFCHKDLDRQRIGTFHLPTIFVR